MRGQRLLIVAELPEPERAKAGAQLSGLIPYYWAAFVLQGEW
ncbi:MAG: hypothetical protein ACKVZH_03995 [Blastocatellia bacterium]